VRAQGDCHQDFRRVWRPVRREEAAEVPGLHESLDRSRRSGDRPGKRGDRGAVSVEQHKTGYVAGRSQLDPQAQGSATVRGDPRDTTHPATHARSVPCMKTG
jgi:hypothetical protein